MKALKALEDKKPEPDDGEGEEEEDEENDDLVDVVAVDNTKPDKSSCTKAQMHVFKKYFSSLPEDIQDKFNELCKPGGAPGTINSAQVNSDPVQERPQSFAPGLPWLPWLLRLPCSPGSPQRYRVSLQGHYSSWLKSIGPY